MKINKFHVNFKREKHVNAMEFTTRVKYFLFTRIYDRESCVKIIQSNIKKNIIKAIT